MKKKIYLRKSSTIIWALFIAYTIAVLFILFMDIDGPFVFPFLIGYLFIAFLSIIYYVVVILMRIKTLNRVDVRKLMLKFFSYFLILSGLSYIIDHGFKIVEVDFYGVFAIPLGLSAGLAFFDLIYLKKKQSGQ